MVSRPAPLPIRLVALAGSLLGVSTTLSAQCASSWQALSSLPGANSVVHAMTAWDRDGAGALPPLLVAGGAFDVAGPLSVGGLVAFDPSNGQWSSLGGGVRQTALATGVVTAMTTSPQGDLVVAGAFTTAGGVAAVGIARWDGSSWHPFAGSFDGLVKALAVLPNGDLVAAGAFALADGNAVDNIARWNGTTWLPLGLGLNNGVNCLAMLPNGHLVAGGSFTASGSTGVPFLARWDGSNWSAFAGGMTGDVHALAVAPTGDLYVGGGFAGAAGVNATGIARWNGTSWSGLGSGTSNPVYAITVAPNGDVVIGGLLIAVDGVPALRLARWNGVQWSPVGVGLPSGTVYGLAHLPDGTLCVGGNLGNGDLAGTSHLLHFDGASFGPLQRGTGGSVNTSRLLGNGDLVVGGSFRQVAGIAASGVAVRSGAAWSELGGGVDGTVNTVLELANGDLLVGGSFANAGGAPAVNVARWDGSVWSPMGAGLPASVHRLVQRPNGQIVASGAFFERGAVWNGTSWSGTGVANGLAATFPVRAMTVLPDGTVAASCVNLLPGGSSHGVFDGTSWTALPPLAGYANDYLVAQNGDLVAVGGLFSATAMRLRGATWQPLGPVTALFFGIHELPNGEFLAFSGGNNPAVHRFDGTTWNVVASLTNGTVRTVTAEADGSLFLGGDFLLFDGQVASRMARMTSNCPAGVLVAGSGCSGSGGVNALAAASLPWIGSTFRSTAIGLPANGIAIEVLGFAPTLLPLSSLLPEGGLGCNLLVAPIAFGLQLPTAGSVGLQLAVPNDAALVGSIVRQQVVAADFGPAGSLTALTASNALQLVVGAL